LDEEETPGKALRLDLTKRAKLEHIKIDLTDFHYHKFNHADKKGHRWLDYNTPLTDQQDPSTSDNEEYYIEWRASLRLRKLY
jgi:hypothetical protein